MNSIRPKNCGSNFRLTGVLRSLLVMMSGVLAVVSTATLKFTLPPRMICRSIPAASTTAGATRGRGCRVIRRTARSSRATWFMWPAIRWRWSRGQWQAWWLKAGTSVDTTIYTNLTFWLYGSTSGQTISVAGELGGSGSGLPSVTVTAPSNTWQRFTISLSSLGVNNKTNLTGFQFGNTTTTQPRFIDDVRLVAAPAPATVHVSVNANQTVRTVDSKVFSINRVAGMAA